MPRRTNQYTQQIANVAVVYNIYRIVLPLVLLVTYITNTDGVQFGSIYNTLFIQVTTGYAIFGVVISFLSPNGAGLLRNQRILTSTIIADIIAISLLMYTSGGIGSGLGLLMIVTIASGSIMIRGRISTFLAAVATLAIIYCEAYLALSQLIQTGQFVQSGILGIILFGTSLYIQTLTDRIYRAAQLAERQASDIIDLEQLNNEIIQRMRTGIVLVNSDNRIVMMNNSAQTTLASILEERDAGNPILPEALLEQLTLWKINSKRQPHAIKIPNSNKQVQLNFAFLKPESDSDVLIFLEDNLQIVQRVRQMKLASLGRLTASIAHEVRNPLGAISHASQLLSESDSIQAGDKRILEIILNHCKRVNMIIEDVLDASRQDESSPSRIKLRSWLQNFIYSYRETNEVCDEIALTIEPEDMEVNIITGQLEQVLNNLFDNGLRYSMKTTGRRTLSLEAGLSDREGEEQPFLHIIDDGPGIEEQAEAHLFEPFNTTEDNGTGLGLYISRELCEANQAQLSYSRTPEGKSAFSIYFSHPDRSVE